MNAIKRIRGLAKLEPINDQDSRNFADWGNSITQETKDAIKKIDANRLSAEEKSGSILVA